MNKKKQIVTKIISGLIVFTFIISIFQFALPRQTLAEKAIDWENPNKTGKAYNTYKFKITDVVNSQVAMQVVGCTGVVNKVAEWAGKLVTSEAMKTKAAEKLFTLAQKSCTQIEKAATTSAAGLQSFSFTDVVPLIFDCKKIQSTKDAAGFALLVQEQKDKVQKDKLEACYNGIAITLAKNQLTAMTRSAVSWVNTGFGGNPLYVQNITSLTNGIERNIVEPATTSLINPNYAYPYGNAFARSLVNYHQSRSGDLFIGGANTLDGLTSDLGNFITDPTSYLPGASEKTALQRAKDANYAFSNDFSTGGWDGWLALTQKDQNNPLGFTMQASQRLADKLAFETQNQKDELMQNNGFLSQKKCVKWQLYDDKGKALNKNTVSNAISTRTLSTIEYVYSPSRSRMDPNYDVCVEFEVTNPGTIIKDKISGYLGSPERQLEMADTINKSLNAVFSILISKLQLGGLSGLSSEEFKYTDDNANWIDTTNDGYASSLYSNNGSYSSGFDLTRDLGNTYVYDKPFNAGTWDAKTGTINGDIKKGTLSLGYIPPVYEGGVEKSPTNAYYTTNVAGSQKIVDYGYNGWAIGDRAFWNGIEWQNWKKDQTNPIKKRGVIQIQNDYIVAAKEILQVLPNVMPKFGELDYCIPGPNPSYKTNSANAQTSYLDWVGTLTTTAGGRKGKFNTYEINKPGDIVYENFKSTFTDNLNVWKALLNSGFISWPSELGDGTTEKGKGVGRPVWIDDFLYFIDNLLFSGFYKEFDNMMDKLYFKNITKMYNETENTGELTKNPAYISMAEEGYSLTKNMLTYSEDIATSTEEYKANIATTQSNIGKLEAIRKEVSVIIKAAQKVRDDKLLIILKEETQKKCKAESESCLRGVGVPSQVNTADLGEYCLTKNKTCEGNIMTEAEYKAKYAACFAEEDILYYDDSSIMSGGATEERCTNGLDDDLDGLIDKLDPDCQ